MEDDIISNLRKAVWEYDTRGAIHWATKAVEEKIDPMKAMDALVEAIRQIGEGFGKGDLWLPDLIGAADALQSAMPIIQEEIERRGTSRESLGTVVIGSVYGDIHNIGKSMVASLLTAEGFEVHDLGINVEADKFLEGINNHKANVLAMSALLTSTAPEAKKVIDILRREGVRDKLKIMVGGGAITQDFAEQIGADGYDPTAPGAVRLARSLLGK